MEQSILKIDQENPLYVVAMGEMSGFPNPITGALPLNYVELLRKELEKNQIPSQVYNLQNLFFQKSTFLYTMLKYGVSLEEISLLYQNSIEATRKDFFTKLTVRSSVANHYFKSNSKETLASVLRHEHSAFLNATAANDLMFACQENMFSILAKSCRMHAASQLDSTMMEHLLQQICQNYELLYGMNPKMKIYEIGFTVPEFFNLLTHDEAGKTIVSFLKSYRNNILKQAQQYQVTYIDGSTLEKNTFGQGQVPMERQIMNHLWDEVTPVHCKESTQKTDNPILFSFIAMSKEYQDRLSRLSQEGFPTANLDQEYQDMKNCYQKTSQQIKR